MKFIIILSAILIIAAGFIFSQTTKAPERVKPYYSGDAISYNGRLFIASTDMKGVEIFEVKDNKIYLLKNEKNHGQEIYNHKKNSNYFYAYQNNKSRNDEKLNKESEKQKENNNIVGYLPMIIVNNL